MMRATYDVIITHGDNKRFYHRRALMSKHFALIIADALAMDLEVPRTVQVWEVKPNYREALVASFPARKG